MTKDALTAKLQLAMFTESVDDNRALAARVAQLETELAAVALSYSHKEQAFHALCAAAAAHRELGELRLAAGCLERARGMDAGDAESNALLLSALSDVHKKLAPKPAPKPAKPAKPAPKPAPKPKPAKPAPKPGVSEPKKKKKAQAKRKPARKTPPKYDRLP